MVVRVYCSHRSAGVSFDECEACAKCLPTPIIEALREYEYNPERNTYYLAEILCCLKKSYYQRKTSQDKYHSLRSLYKKKRGKLFSKIMGTSGWQELRGCLSYDIDGEPVKLTARLDCYDPNKKEIIELKSLELDKQKKYLPRDKDKLQVQCYGTIFKPIFLEVKGLKIVYLDMSNYEQYDVPIEDKSEWMKQRVIVLHRAIRDSQPPPREESYECQHCEYADKCSLLVSPVPSRLITKNNSE